MIQQSLNKLIAGYQRFYESYKDASNNDYREVRISAIQKPKIMVISCCDSRVNPTIITDSRLGEIFTVSNVANLVPPYKEGKDTHHSTSAALEFALNSLGIEHVIVLGHSGCGGIKALMKGNNGPTDDSYSFIQPWMSIAKKARDRVLEKYHNCSFEQQTDACERESLLVSLNNLQSFPWVQQALERKALALHAWHFDIKSGMIEQYDQEQSCFMPLAEFKI